MGAKRFKGRRRPRITGVSVPIGGVQWEWTPSEREVLRKLIVVLEGRRALRHAHCYETKDAVTDSILSIHKELTATIQNLSEGSHALPALYTMREACEEFLTFAEMRLRRRGRPFDPSAHRQWAEALDQLRIEFVQALHSLVDGYQLEIHGRLNAFVTAQRYRLRL